MRVGPYRCFYELGVLFVGGFIVRALVFGVLRPLILETPIYLRYGVWQFVLKVFRLF